MSVYRSKQVTVNNLSWTAIAPVGDCHSLKLRNDDTAINLLKRSDSADATSQEVITPGNEVRIEAVGTKGYRLRAGRTLFYVQAASSTITGFQDELT